tara:strand:- start:16732 stop:18039 length:1308 start_codon:yes stop_codon:yes gene_type:complete
MKVTPALTITDAMTADGPELITDGDMSNPASFTLGAGWAIAGGLMTHTPGTFTEVTQAAAWVEGDLHTVGLTIASRTAGAMNLALGAFVAGSTIGQQSANGALEFKNTAGSSGGLTRIEPTISSFDGTIDNLSVKKEFSNIVENDLVRWDSGTAYIAGDERMVTSGDVHSKYKCLVSNTNFYPPDNTAAAIGQTAIDAGVVVNWEDLGPTNRWAMLTSTSGIRSENANTIVVEITPGEVINFFAAINVDANTVQVIMTDPIDGEVYNRTVDLSSTVGIVGMYAWLFNPVENATSIVLEDLPPYFSATIKVIYTKTGSTVFVGSQVIGLQKTLGVSDHGTSIGIINFSRKEQDVSGNYVFDEKGFKRRASYIVTVEPDLLSSTEELLGKILNIPSVWIGEETIEPTIVFGFYTDHNTVLAGPTLYDLSIEVEGLIQ